MMKPVPRLLRGTPLRTRCFYRLLAAWATGLYLLLGSASASAQVCTMLATPPTFVSYNAANPDKKVNGLITVTCVTVLPASFSYTVKLGLSGFAQLSQRRMSNGAGGYLNYNVYCDSAYGVPWVDGVGASCLGSGGASGFLGSLVTPFTVFGKIPSGQFIASGNYNDSITIEVLY